MKIYLSKISNFKNKEPGGIEILFLKLERKLEDEVRKQILSAKVVRTEGTNWSADETFILWDQEGKKQQILFVGRLLSAQLIEEVGLWQLLLTETSVEDFSMSEERGMPCENLLDVTSSVFEGTIKFHELQPPRFLRLTLQAEWLQKLEGILDLSSNVAALFPRGRVSSLNRTFGAVQFDGAKTGYTLLSASFEPEWPPETGALAIYPTTTPPLKVRRKSEKQKQSSEVVLPRYWFKVTWKVAWFYEQKRVETFSTKILFHPFGEGELNIRLKVPHVETLEKFDEGMATLESLWPTLLKEAEVQIKENIHKRFQRKVTFAIPFEDGFEMTLGRRVQIRLANEILRGCVQSVEFEADGVQQEARVTMSSTEDWLATWKAQTWKLGTLQEDQPVKGLTVPLTSENAILEGAVENDAEAQFTALARQTWTSPQEIAAFLKEHSTRISLRLRDLRTQKRLEHFLIAETIVT